MRSGFSTGPAFLLLDSHWLSFRLLSGSRTLLLVSWDSLPSLKCWVQLRRNSLLQNYEQSLSACSDSEQTPCLSLGLGTRPNTLASGSGGTPQPTQAESTGDEPPACHQRLALFNSFSPEAVTIQGSALTRRQSWLLRRQEGLKKSQQAVNSWAEGTLWGRQEARGATGQSWGGRVGDAPPITLD